MIGFYNYSVILTYVGLTSAVIGMTQVFHGNYRAAFLCLCISGICDMFDGNIARAMKNRTEQEKIFGIQIDSLCDLICFGMFPATLGYSIAGNKILGGIASVLLVLGAVIRLAYFNVTEQERQKETSEKRKYYQGLPVTSVSMIMPSFYILRDVFGKAYPNVFAVIMLITAILFVTDFRMRKPGKVGSIIMAIGGVIIVAGVLFV